MTGTSLSSDGFPSLQYSQGILSHYTFIPPKFWNFLDLPSLHLAPLSYSFVTMMGWSSWGNWAATLLAFVSLKNDGYVLEDYSNIHQFIVKHT